MTEEMTELHHARLIVQVQFLVGHVREEVLLYLEPANKYAEMEQKLLENNVKTVTQFQETDAQIPV